MKKKSKPPKKKKLSLFSLCWKCSKWLSLCLFCYTLWSSYKIYTVGHADHGRDADCAIVFGAAVWHKKPSPVFQARLDHAILLYREGRVKTILVTGGRGEGAPFAESEVGRDYCLANGVKAQDICIEMNSQTTHENVREAYKVMQEENLADALLVSDPWHLRRASLMAADEGIELSCSATQTSKYESFGTNFLFFAREFFFVQVYHVFGI